MWIVSNMLKLFFSVCYLSFSARAILFRRSLCLSACSCSVRQEIFFSPNLGKSICLRICRRKTLPFPQKKKQYREKKIREPALPLYVFERLKPEPFISR